MWYMTRFGYLWVFISVAISIFAVTHESVAREDSIRNATKSALHAGVKDGCVRDNRLLLDVQRTALRLHPEASAKGVIQGGLVQQDCDKLADKFVAGYLHASH